MVGKENTNFPGYLRPYDFLVKDPLDCTSVTVPRKNRTTWHFPMTTIYLQLDI